MPEQKTNNSRFIWIMAVIALIAAGIIASRLWKTESTEGKWVCQNGEWVAQDNPVTRQPSEPCGENPGEKPESPDEVSLSEPESDAQVSSPVEISGQARGGWFFEATMPARLETENGNEIAQGFVQAQGDWMTEEMVPFQGELEYDISSSTRGYLILEKANPSGLPENADSYGIPVRITP